MGNQQLTYKSADPIFDSPSIGMINTFGLNSKSIDSLQILEYYFARANGNQQHQATIINADWLPAASILPHKLLGCLSFRP